MGRILAITGLTLKGAFRVRVFITLLLLLGLCVIVVPLTVKSDGTVQGHVQMLLSYSLGISFALLSLSTIWLGCDSMCRDVEEMQIHLIATKPVARWEIWVGKWLGIMTLNASLLALVGAITYASLLWTTRPGALTKDQRDRLVHEVLVARRGVQPQYPDVSAEVEEQYRKDDKEGKVPTGTTPAKYKEKLRNDILTRRYTSSQRQPIRWTFQGLHLDPKAEPVIFVRCKYQTSRTPPSGTLDGRWVVGEPDSPNRFEMVLNLRAGSFHEFAIPAQAVTPEGKLTVEYTNVDAFPTTAVFPVQDGIEVLHRVGSFLGNYARSLLLLLIPLGFLAALGLCAGSFLTFPVAVFVSLAFLSLALMSTNLEMLLQQGLIFASHGTSHGVQLANWRIVLDSVFRKIIEFGLFMTQGLRGYSPIGRLVIGREVPWSLIGHAALLVLLGQGGAFALLGMALFHRRELAQLHH